MNPGVVARRTAERLSGITTQQILLRAGVAAASVVLLALVPLSGGSLPLPFLVLVLLLTTATMVLPDGWAPLVLLAGLVAVWARGVPDLLDARSVLAAALLFVVHALCVLASYGPPEMALPADLVRAWLRRTTVAVSAAAAVWLAARHVDGADLPGGAWVSVAALALLLGWTGLLTFRLLPRQAVRSSF